MTADLRGARLAIETDISIADFPTASSCLTNIQFIHSEFNQGLQVVAENIDSWRTNLVTRIKLYSSTIADLQTSSNATSYACNSNTWNNSTISTRLDYLTERFNQLEKSTSNNRSDFLTISKSIDTFRDLCDTQVLSLRDQLQSLSESVSTVHAPALSAEVVDSENTVVIEGLCGKVRSLEQTNVTERDTLRGLRDMLIDLSERVDSSLSTAVSSRSASGLVLRDHLNCNRERDVVRKGLERLEKLILQLISTRIPGDYIDIALIRKCNTIDLPALQSAAKTCEKSLLKYLSFQGIDNSFCDHISALLDSAESWGSHVVQANTNAEVHSIKGSPGDVANVGIFSNNADKTIFEFLKSFELGYIDWGINQQRTNKLSKHLSDDLKDTLLTKSDNYALMREWLVQN